MTWMLLLTLSATPCPPGQAVGPETAGQCCWSGQVWSKMQNRCVGAPSCPAGLRADGDQCVADCPAGQSQSADTEGHCCWPNQAWSRSRSVCVGVPVCPVGFAPSGETCVAAASAPPAPPQQYAQPQYAPPQQPQYGSQPPPPPQYPPPAGQQQYPQQQYPQQQYPQQQYPQQQYAQPQYGQQPPAPPQYGPPQPQLTPQQTKVSLLKREFEELKVQRDKLTFSGGIICIAVGIPATALGFVAVGFADQESDIVWGTLLIITGSILTIAGIIDIPVTAARRGNLTRAMTAKQKEIDDASRIGLLPRTMQLASTFGLMSPVLTF